MLTTSIIGLTSNMISRITRKYILSTITIILIIKSSNTTLTNMKI